MQIKEFEAYSLKECLQLVRKDLGPEAVILETRKYRKGGLLGLGAREAVCIVAATGITVQNDLHGGRKERYSVPEGGRSTTAAVAESARSAPPPLPTPSQAAAVAAARSAYQRQSPTAHNRDTVATEERRPASRSKTREIEAEWEEGLLKADGLSETAAYPTNSDGSAQEALAAPARRRGKSQGAQDAVETERLSSLERAMQEIRESLTSLQREQREGQERTVSAVVSAVAPAVNAISLAGYGGVEQEEIRFPELYQRLMDMGVSKELARELMEDLPDVAAWKEQAQLPLAESALRELIARRVASGGAIKLTPGKLKAVALIGPTGVGKTTTIAKLAAHFALVECKKVALLTVDTYRIAAVEQLKTYSQIIDIPIRVAYSHAEVMPAVAEFADYDLLLIDTAGRSQKNIMQVGELKSLLEGLGCETHLVLSAPIKEQDMLEAAQRFSAARVDRLLFSKLDETSTYGSLLNVADRTGIPLSYLTTGQKVPEDIEIADGVKLATLILG
ncbi:MAG TPA: flagellar biosynthesis protein FlhF [Chthonomonadaceae bacterium]|nr:flagellar biosynthesis protein FlhF [Chthonomonadaceae bacterium]